MSHLCGHQSQSELLMSYLCSSSGIITQKNIIDFKPNKIYTYVVLKIKITLFKSLKLWLLVVPRCYVRRNHWRRSGWRRRRRQDRWDWSFGAGWPVDGGQLGCLAWNWLIEWFVDLSFYLYLEKKSASWQLGQLVADLKAKILVVVVFRMFSLYYVYLSILTKPGCLAWNWFDRLIQYLLMYLHIYQFIYLSIFLPGELGPALGCRDVKDVGLGHGAGQLGRGPLVQPAVQLVPDTLCIRRYG